MLFARQRQGKRWESVQEAGRAGCFGSGTGVGGGGDHVGGSVGVDGGSGCYVSDGSAADGDL